MTGIAERVGNKLLSNLPLLASGTISGGNKDLVAASTSPMNTGSGHQAKRPIRGEITTNALSSHYMSSGGVKNFYLTHARSSPPGGSMFLSAPMSAGQLEPAEICTEAVRFNNPLTHEFHPQTATAEQIIELIKVDSKRPSSPENLVVSLLKNPKVSEDEKNQIRQLGRDLFSTEKQYAEFLEIQLPKIQSAKNQKTKNKS